MGQLTGLATLGSLAKPTPSRTSTAVGGWSVHLVVHDTMRSMRFCGCLLWRDMNWVPEPAWGCNEWSFSVFCPPAAATVPLTGLPWPKLLSSWGQPTGAAGALGPKPLPLPQLLVLVLWVLLVLVLLRPAASKPCLLASAFQSSWPLQPPAAATRPSHPLEAACGQSTQSYKQHDANSSNSSRRSRLRPMLPSWLRL